MRDSVRILLIQARLDRAMLLQERECVAERCGVRPEQLRAVNTPSDALGESLLDGADAVVIGGSGEFSVTRTESWTDDLVRLVHAMRERDLPTMGCCWGHQIIALALGGRVVNDPERGEVGTGDVELAEAGVGDPLFGILPRRFRANMGHHDRVDRLPDEGVELAFNAQRNQAFRIGRTRMYGTQFHSELDAHRLRQRLVTYRDTYANTSEDEYRALLEGVEETPEVDGLLSAFVDRFVLGDG